jgi:D-alanyl-D-alanine carboxypeptidase (penicillin-binding protein 5/6)
MAVKPTARLIGWLAALACGHAFAAAPPKIDARSYMLVDFSTDTVLASSAADEHLAPASLTKLMTAYVVFTALKDGSLKLTDRVHVSEKAWRMGGSRMFIEVGSDVAVEDLLRGLLVQSGNDASVALAEHLAGSVDAFAERMNTTARALGMRNTVYRNPHGLPARGHYTTSHDLAVLAKAIIEDFPEYYGLYAEREFSYNGINQYNRNALLKRDPSVDGMKTGHTAAAGYCIVTSAQRDGMRLIAVVLGAQSAKGRNDGAQKLLDYGFANYETHKLYAAGDALELARVKGGEAVEAGLGLEADLYVTIPRGAYAALAATLEAPAELLAPIAAGESVGELRVALAGAQLFRVPLVVLDSVRDGGVWARLRDGVSSFIE